MYGPNNERIGDINEVLVDRNGKVDAIVIGAGGFLGIGEKDVALPFSQVKFVDQARDTRAGTVANATPREPECAGQHQHEPARQHDHHDPSGYEHNSRFCQGSRQRLWPMRASLAMSRLSQRGWTKMRCLACGSEAVTERSECTAQGYRRFRCRACGKAIQRALRHPAEPGPSRGRPLVYDPSNFTFPFGTHIAVVEVSRETGEVKLLRYVAVDDVGNVINPMIVDGMVHGGIAQGIAQALWEHEPYDDSGQLIGGSFMEYAVPSGRACPSVQVRRTERTPTR